MRNQPINNKNHRQHRSNRLITISTYNALVTRYQNSDIVWPVASDRKARSSAFAQRNHPDYQLVIWLAEIMLYLHQNTAKRARWSGPCDHHSRCRLIW